MFSKTDIEKYFIAEKELFGLLLLVVLLATVAAILIFILLKTQAWKGFAAVLFVAGLLQFVFAYPTYKAVDQQRLKLVYAYDMNPSTLSSVAAQKAQAKHKVLTAFIIVEGLMFVAGAVIALYFRRHGADKTWMLIGLALMLEAAITFAFTVKYRAMNAMLAKELVQSTAKL